MPGQTPVTPLHGLPVSRGSPATPWSPPARAGGRARRDRTLRRYPNPPGRTRANAPDGCSSNLSDPRNLRPRVYASPAGVPRPGGVRVEKAPPMEPEAAGRSLAVATRRCSGRRGARVRARAVQREIWDRFHYYLLHRDSDEWRLRMRRGWVPWPDSRLLDVRPSATGDGRGYPDPSRNAFICPRPGRGATDDPGHIQQREEHWAIIDLKGKAPRRRCSGSQRRSRMENSLATAPIAGNDLENRIQGRQLFS